MCLDIPNSKELVLRLYVFSVPFSTNNIHSSVKTSKITKIPHFLQFKKFKLPKSLLYHSGNVTKPFTFVSQIRVCI